MDAKNKSNIKLLSIVASVMLLIIVVGASFAYFGTYKEDIDKYKINITIDQFAKATFVTKDANLNLVVSKKDMVAYEAGTKAAENSANLNVVLTSGNPNVKVTCTYDIYYEYDTNSSIYGVSPTPVTDSSLKELTLKAVGSTGTNNYADEKNFNYDTSWTTNPYKRLIVKGASITDATKNGTTDTWNFNMAFYNLEADQNKLAGKTFAGTFYVDKDSIQCDYQNNESNPTLYQTIENRYNQDKTYLGLYNGEGADTYANPVYYYKGNVQNNNVLFAGFCWKIVRTTETGGVKIVYNGIPKDVYESYEKFNSNEYTIVSNDATYPYTFDSTNKVWKSNILDDSGNGTGYTIEFSPTQDGSYLFNINMHNESGDDYVELYLNDNYIGYGENCGDGCLMIDDTDSINLSLSPSDVITITYNKGSTTTDNSDYVDFSLQKGIGNPVKNCNNTRNDSQIYTSAFNLDFKSPAYVGYMHNIVYTYSKKAMSSQSNIVFGNSFTYNNGTYTLTGTKTVATWSSGYNTINNNHYTCMTTGITCSSIYYVYYTHPSWAYYITLTGGKSVSDALNEMLYANDVNKNDSTIKANIDSWYKYNIKDKYDKKLEDTVFCNDRGILNLNGWNPNGGDTASSLQFKNYDTNNQSLVCANETDRFSHSNTKAYLKYPIGLLSLPELSLSGYSNANGHYFNSTYNVWLGSPGYFSYENAYVRGVDTSGWDYKYVSHSRGVRPSISIKPGTSFSSGNGSYTLPFVID